MFFVQSIFYRKMWVLLYLAVILTIGTTQFLDTSNLPQDRFDQVDTSTRQPWNTYDDKDSNSGLNYKLGSQEKNLNPGVYHRESGSQDWKYNSGINYRNPGSQEPSSEANYRGNQDIDRSSGHGYNRNFVTQDSLTSGYGGFRNSVTPGDNVIIREA